MYRVRGTMDQRGSTVSGFIRIDRPGNTLLDRQRNCSACESAYSSGAGECALENAHQHGGYVGDVPVSYTHLDVYKRQAQGRCGCAAGSHSGYGGVAGFKRKLHSQIQTV